MRDAGWRRASLALVLLAGVLITPAGPAAARSAIAPAAACTSGSNGVTVVVDFAGLGGGVQIRCVTEPVSSGFDALTQAGFTFDGTQRFPGLLCRIDGKPSSDPCVKAPAPDRYWAYWHADQPGGAWTYSDSGGGNRTPPPGSVEGWAWSDGCTRQPQGAPCPGPTTTTKPTTTTTRPRGGGSGSTDTGYSRGATSTTSPRGGVATTMTTAPDGAATSDGASTSTSADKAAGGTAPAAGATGDEEQASSSTGVGADDDGSPAGALITIAIVLALGGAAFATARRRARERGPT